MTTVFCEYNESLKMYVVFKEWSETVAGQTDTAISILRYYISLTDAIAGHPHLHYIGNF